MVGEDRDVVEGIESTSTVVGVMAWVVQEIGTNTHPTNTHRTHTQATVPCRPPLVTRATGTRCPHRNRDRCVGFIHACIDLIGKGRVTRGAIHERALSTVCVDNNYRM